MIKNLIFDMGGVVFDLSFEQAVKRFEEIGVSDASKWLNASSQQGIFGQLEGGLIDTETFRASLSRQIGKELTHAQCDYAWKGFILCLRQRNLDKLLELGSRGYRRVLLSNTNPYITAWAHSNDFSRIAIDENGQPVGSEGPGHPMDYYLDYLYFSCDLKMMKPGKEIFEAVLKAENFVPEECLFIDDSPKNTAVAESLGLRTMCPQNNSDWTEEIEEYLL